MQGDEDFTEQVEGNEEFTEVQSKGESLNESEEVTEMQSTGEKFPEQRGFVRPRMGIGERGAPGNAYAGNRVV